MTGVELNLGMCVTRKIVPLRTRIELVQNVAGKSIHLSCESDIILDTFSCPTDSLSSFVVKQQTEAETRC